MHVRACATCMYVRTCKATGNKKGNYCCFNQKLISMVVVMIDFLCDSS